MEPSMITVNWTLFIFFHKDSGVPDKTRTRDDQKIPSEQEKPRESQQNQEAVLQVPKHER